MSEGFAVVDIETTGLFPSKDRIVELAVVHVDPSGSIVGKFCTLIDPQRDIGPTSIHGLTASSVLGAPVFSDVVPTIWQLLTGRVFVAHNARFDLTFLDVELARCGFHLPPRPVMCTMNLSSSYFKGLPSRSLVACCEMAGVKLTDHHSALGDALAAAELLACYRSAHTRLPTPWEDEIRAASRTNWPAVPLGENFRPVTRAEQSLRKAAEHVPLADLVHRLPRGSGGDVEHYFGVLDQVLEDRIVTSDEYTELLQIAEAFGITQEDAEKAHRDYLKHVAAAAWTDGIVSDAERADFVEVARLLAVPTNEALTILNVPRDRGSSLPYRGVNLEAGDRIAFTGEMENTREKLEGLATAAGYRITSSVSSKTALLVIADPHSQSAKARRARELGVRIVVEQVFVHLVGVS